MKIVISILNINLLRNLKINLKIIAKNSLFGSKPETKKLT